MKKKTAAFSTKTLLTIHNGYLNTLAHKNTAHNIKKKSHRDKIKFVLHYKRTSLFLRYLKKQKQKKKKVPEFLQASSEHSTMEECNTSQRCNKSGLSS